MHTYTLSFKRNKFESWNFFTLNTSPNPPWPSMFLFENEHVAASIVFKSYCSEFVDGLSSAKLKCQNWWTQNNIRKGNDIFVFLVTKTFAPGHFTVNIQNLWNGKRIVFSAWACIWLKKNEIMSKIWINSHGGSVFLLLQRSTASADSTEMTTPMGTINATMVPLVILLHSAHSIETQETIYKKINYIIRFQIF